jgi:hypothetical protein
MHLCLQKKAAAVAAKGKGMDLLDETPRKLLLKKKKRSR